jgi:hypothetical protein
MARQLSTDLTRYPWYKRGSGRHSLTVVGRVRVSTDVWNRLHWYAAREQIGASNAVARLLAQALERETPDFPGD